MCGLGVESQYIGMGNSWVPSHQLGKQEASTYNLREYITKCMRCETLIFLSPPQVWFHSKEAHWSGLCYKARSSREKQETWWSDWGRIHYYSRLDYRPYSRIWNRYCGSPHQSQTSHLCSYFHCHANRGEARQELQANCGQICCLKVWRWSHKTEFRIALQFMSPDLDWLWRAVLNYPLT